MVRGHTHVVFMDNAPLQEDMYGLHYQLEKEVNIHFHWTSILYYIMANNTIPSKTKGRAFTARPYEKGKNICNESEKTSKNQLSIHIL